MANYITISTIGARPYELDPVLPLEDAVEKMIQHWQEELAQVLPERPDLIVLPEACDRPPNFSLERRHEYYRVRGSRIEDFFADVAKEHNCYIAYSAARDLPDGTRRNTTSLLDRQGEVLGRYNKNHLVIGETTEANILCGKDAPLIETDFGTVACAICFDLNFDELRLKYVEAQPDLIIFSSMYHGGLMQNYWAYSCRAHFASAIAGLPSGIISPVGESLVSSTNYFNYVTGRVNLDCDVVHLDENWSKLDAMKAKYGAGVKITDPGYLGAVLISSETKEVTISELIAEFEIERLDEYFNRSLAHRHRNLEL